MRTHRLETETWLPRPLEEVFEFFSDAKNLESITPPSVNFRITQLPETIEQGTLIDYRIRIRGIPVRWRTKIHRWEPPHRFTDAQLKGPYRLWYHEHRFESADGGTQMYDRVLYRVPGGLLEPWIHRAFVKDELRKIFEYRSESIQQLLGAGEGRRAEVRFS